MADKVLKHIPEQKLKAFSIGTMGRRQPSKKEIEESKKKEQEKAAAQAFEEFVATFQEVPNKTGKVWVKAGTYDAGKRQEDTKEKGKLYKPQSRLDKDGGCSSAEKAQEYAKLLGDRVKPDKPGKKKEKEKKKSNLELFKEELKLIQEEREERHKYKGVVKSNVVDPEVAKGSSIMAEDKGSFDSGDPNTTNIYLGNINPKITEQQLMEVFGKYGPLASIKIMWPRSDEEKSRGRNCGFVAFMNRRDGDRAMKALNGKDVLGYEMKLGWGKGVPIPPYPIYIPPTLLSLTQPPPPSGLPFNAQPHPKDKHKVPKMRPNEPYPENPDDQDKVEKILPQALVKVVMPTDRNLLMLIHHMIEYVIREGPMFEAMIMNREISNPLFRFLFDNQSPAHAYYRWKLFSLLQGDSQKEWCLQEFRMFKGGSVWRPPPMNLYTQGMPDELIEKDDDRKGGLSPAQRDRLEHLIRSITPGRLKVADAMVFCIEHSDAADEICDCIVESLSNPDTVIYKKIARLYLVSDILHNCGLKITNASFYRRCLESRLPDIFLQAHLTFTSLDSRLKAEAFRVRVMSIFSAWEDWAIYPKDFLHRLKRTFLGSLADEEESDEVDTDKECSDDERRPPDIPEPEPDGEDLDGIPLDGAALLKSAFKHTAPPPQALSSDDLDGIPMDDDLDGKPMEDEEGSPEPIVEATEIMLGVSGPSRDSMVSGGSSPPVRRPPPPPGAFVPSRWETVDPELIEAQAMTTSKWEMLEQQQRRQVQQQQIQQQQQQTPQDQQQQVQPHPLVNLIKDDDQQSTPQQEDVEETSLDSCRDLQEEIRRAKLREIELKVIQYQDELESGKRILKPGFTFPEQIEHHRKKLLRKAERADKERTVEKMSRKSSGSPDGSSESKCRRRKSKSSSYSPPSKRSHNRSRSRSPFSARKSRRSSRSPRKDSPESKRRKGVVSPRIAGSKRRGSSIEGASSPPGSHSKRRGSGSTSPRRGRSRSRRSQSPLTLPHRRRRTPSSTSPPPPSSHRGKHSKRSESSSSSSKRHKHKHRH